jgi:ABC-type proline/glycine betaine transport system ATPase subunit
VEEEAVSSPTDVVTINVAVINGEAGCGKTRDSKLIYQQVNAAEGRANNKKYNVQVDTSGLDAG